MVLVSRIRQTIPKLCLVNQNLYEKDVKQFKITLTICSVTNVVVHSTHIAHIIAKPNPNPNPNLP